MAKHVFKRVGIAVTAILAVVGFAGSAQAATYIHYGDRGNAVFCVQDALARDGYTLQGDGIFGNDTLNRLEQFQTKHGLSADGVVGPQTGSALYALLDGQSLPETEMCSYYLVYQTTH
jgi:peptidoglycan hydrolase-like protein with peptidoglycan-binding domain